MEKELRLACHAPDANIDSVLKVSPYYYRYQPICRWLNWNVGLLSYQCPKCICYMQVLDRLVSKYEATCQGPEKWRKLIVFLQQRFVY